MSLNGFGFWWPLAWSVFVYLLKTLSFTDGRKKPGLGAGHFPFVLLPYIFWAVFSLPGLSACHSHLAFLTCNFSEESLLQGLAAGHFSLTPLPFMYSAAYPLPGLATGHSLFVPLPCSGIFATDTGRKLFCFCEFAMQVISGIVAMVWV